MDLIPLLNDLGRWLVVNLWPMSLELALWTALVWLILYALRVHSPTLRHLAWVLVLLKPLTTFLWQSPVSLYTVLPALSAGPLVPIEGFPRAVGVAEPTGSVAVAIPAPEILLSRHGVLALLWSAVAVVLLLRLAVGQVVLVRLLRRAVNVDAGLLYQLLQEAAAGLGVRRSVRLALTDSGGPLVAGIFRPVVILPRQLAESLSPEQLRLIFAHELAHVQRFDNLALLGQQLAEVPFFFHPSTWLCRRGLRLEAEKACDDAVLRRFPQPARYADSLARVAELGNSQRSYWLTGTAGAVESRLGWRITRILEARSMSGSRSLTVFAVLGLAVVGVLGLPGFLKHTESAGAEVRTLQAAAQTVQPDTLMLLPTRPTVFYDRNGHQWVEVDTSSFHLIYKRTLADSTGQDGQEFFCVHVRLGLTGERGEMAAKERAADSSQVATMIAPFLGKSKAIITETLGGWTVPQLFGRPAADQAGQEIKDRLNEEILSQVSLAGGLGGGGTSIQVWQVEFSTLKVRSF